MNAAADSLFYINGIDIKHLHFFHKSVEYLQVFTYLETVILLRL
ncbi:hypothetical protein Barb6_02999 [Bacteroidales bacterium Barb6]|nr:hypothetical protein Barb6_02999 [Bacteroidales bacterium Barb6]